MLHLIETQRIRTRNGFSLRIRLDGAPLESAGGGGYDKHGVALMRALERIAPEALQAAQDSQANLAYCGITADTVCGMQGVGVMQELYAVCGLAVTVDQDATPRSKTRTVYRVSQLLGVIRSHSAHA